METRQEILSNPLFPALQKVNHTSEQDIYVWSMGLGFHNHNLLSALNENVKDPVTREAVQRDLWEFFYSVGLQRPNKVLSVTAKPVLQHLNQILTDIMNDAKHLAILGMGDTVEEAILNWVKTFAIYDFAAYTYLEKHLGAKEGLRLYMGLWEIFALGELDNYKKALGIDDTTEITMDIIGKLSRAYWESIACPYHVTQHSNMIHEAEIETCPYWQNMKLILGEPKCRSMTLKAETATSVNYYDAILKALGVFGKYSFTMDKFACCGDDVCRVRFERRHA
jgi:hypothetical protein